MRISGTMFYYYFICKRKLWNFANYINYEDENENVKIGKLIDESSYDRENKQILIDETVNVDFIKDWKTLHEVKKSDSIEIANIWQVKYYIYFLRKRNINIEKGVIDYPKLRKCIEVIPTEQDFIEIENTLTDIECILSKDSPPTLENKKICRACAYYEYCFI